MPRRWLARPAQAETWWLSRPPPSAIGPGGRAACLHSGRVLRFRPSVRNDASGQRRGGVVRAVHRSRIAVCGRGAGRARFPDGRPCDGRRVAWRRRDGRRRDGVDRTSTRCARAHGRPRHGRLFRCACGSRRAAVSPTSHNVGGRILAFYAAAPGVRAFRRPSIALARSTVVHPLRVKDLIELQECRPSPRSAT